jgi:hypothetical protein
VAQRKNVTSFASAAGRKGAKKLVARRRSTVSPDGSVPVAPADDLIPVEIQREKGLGPDFDPAYFDSLDVLVEKNFGPITGEFKVISG